MTDAIYADEYDLFSLSTPMFKITKPIRLIELFAGIGSQAKALQNLGADFVRWKAVEFDKYALRSYNAIHGTDFEVSDIRDIHATDLEITDTDKFCYIMTYSFPCQDLSIAGQMKGMRKGSSTRSGLLWEVERILDECDNLPQVLLMENVPMVISKKNLKDFQSWRLKLEQLGYSNFVQLLNAKDYGVPQNRNRCFMVSIFGNYSYQFPASVELNKRLKDVLEESVNRKYFLSLEKISKSIEDYMQKSHMVSCADSTKPIRLFNIDGEYGTGFSGNVWEKECIAPTIMTFQGGNKQPMVIVDDLVPCDYRQDKGIMVRKNGMMPCLRQGGGGQALLLKGKTIRKLTPRECWRLMDFTDEDFDKAQKVNSDSQLYKQAGNSIVVKVLEEIFKEML